MRKTICLFLLLVCGIPVLCMGEQPATADPTITQMPTQATTTATTPAKRITAYTLPPELYQKARRLNRMRFGYRIFSLFYSVFVLWLVLQTRWSAKFRDWAEASTGRRFLQALIFTALFALTVAILQLPFDILEEYVARLYHISVQTWASWAGDWAKAQALLIVIGGILVWILYAVIRRSPQRWWFYFWIISLPILLFLFFISPFVIEPMFNKFEPLASKDPQLIPLLQRVTHRAGQEIPPERMFWMKASDKTNFTNAYVTGFGASKRIVIWDTTIEKETPDEVVVDFGHEMGHYVLGHIWKGLIFSAALFLILIYAGYRSIGWLLARYGSRWRIRSLGDWASLPALLLVITVFGFVADVAGNTFSRFQEHQADVYGLEITHGIIPDAGQAAAHSFQIAGEIGLADPNPNPVNTFLFADHPSFPDRVHFFVTYDPWDEGREPQFVK
jgi:Zn-dependent protease with chaperone function